MTNTYTTGAEMRAHYRAVRERLGLSRPPPVVRRRKPEILLYEAPIGPERPGPYVSCVVPWILSLEEIERPKLVDIKTAVCRVFYIKLYELEGPRRWANLVRARFCYYWIARKWTGRGFPEIGRRCGKKDHTSVMNGVKSIEANRAKYEPELSQVIAMLGLQ